MSRLSRTKQLIAYISEVKEAKLEDIADHFDVSAMTIRRDLMNLEGQGFLTINRGRAVLNAGTSLEWSSSLKDSQMSREKKRIAQEASKHVAEGTSIFLDCGTTVSELAYLITDTKNITVVTNSLLVINTLCNFSNLKLVSLPGVFHAKSMGFYDTSTYRYLQNICVDVAFMGAESVDSSLGFMAPDSDDCECKKKICERSQKVIVLADSSKIGKKSMYHYANFNDVDFFITDNKCAQEDVDKIRQSTTCITCV